MDLEARDGSKVGKFLHPLKYYAEVYGQTDRTIKRWLQTGRTALGGPDLPPLDDPVRMCSWWAFHYKHRVPDGILEAAKSAPALISGEAVAPKSVFSASDETSVPEANALGTGFSEMLERMKKAEAAAYREYDKALKAGDEARLPAMRKVWGELSKQLRELERDAHDILSRSGTLLDRTVCERILGEIHAPIASGIRSMWRRVKARMKAAASDAEEDRIWQEECDRLLWRLNQSAFTEAV